MVERNWRAEVETAQAYRDLAAREQDEKRKGILIRMAEAEERHAQRWEKNFAISAQSRQFSKIQFDAVLIVGGTGLPAPISPFAEWKQPKSGMRRSFATSVTAPWPEKRMCGISCERAPSKRKHTPVR